MCRRAVITDRAVFFSLFLVITTWLNNISQIYVNNWRQFVFLCPKNQCIVCRCWNNSQVYWEAWKDLSHCWKCEYDGACIWWGWSSLRSFGPWWRILTSGLLPPVCKCKTEGAVGGSQSLDVEPDIFLMCLGANSEPCLSHKLLQIFILGTFLLFFYAEVSRYFGNGSMKATKVGKWFLLS